MGYVNSSQLESKQSMQTINNPTPLLCLYAMYSVKTKGLTGDIYGNFFFPPLPNVARECFEARVTLSDGRLGEEEGARGPAVGVGACGRIREVGAAQPGEGSMCEIQGSMVWGEYRGMLVGECVNVHERSRE